MTPITDNNSIEAWSRGIPYEVAFWNNVYRWRHTLDGMLGWSNYGSVIDLEMFDANAFLSSRPCPKVLDVGCGMSYATGNLLRKGGREVPLDIHYVDPLASSFNKILARWKKDMPRIEPGMAECLSAFYPGHDVDLVIIQNALDHSASPLKGIVEAMETLAVGGVLYLNHHPNEAETERYKGFHKYNIDIDGDDLVIWNKAERRSLRELVGGFASVGVRRHASGHVIAVVTKLADVPPGLIDRAADLRCACVGLLESHIGKLGMVSAVAFALRYRALNIVQMAVQALPWGLKMGLKRMLKQA